VAVTNKGKVWFIQSRPGKHGKIFNVIKFKTMNDRKDEQGNLLTDADRLTALGKFIRKTSLDEMPQLINVIKGDMSIVGPRPHMLKHTADYSKIIDEYMIRQFLKPGITGWAQVSGFRGETKTLDQMKKRVEYDLWYMENWSTWLDIKVMFLTVFNTIKGEENAF
jgi:putative colanic acid biosynthesis UDP-glucose lipid carrier transferase